MLGGALSFVGFVLLTLAFLVFVALGQVLPIVAEAAFSLTVRRNRVELVGG